MDRRTLLKIMGGIAALPALGKAIKGTGIKSIKSAGKVLPKVQGMPEWFTPLVNKIMKEGVDISPTVKRVEDMTTVKKLEIPSATGEPDVITLTQNKITGEISIESNVAGSVDNSPFELNYRPPKTDIDVTTGKPVKYPGDFSVIENRPRPTSEPGDYEFDYENLRVEDAYSDVERLEKIATGKIKDAKKIEERAAGRKMLEESPYEDIINRYPDPDIGDYDYADGGLASFINGGKVKKKKIAKDEPEDEYGDPQTGEKRIPLMQGIRRGYDFENTMPNIYNSPRLSQVDLADGGVASMFRERSEYSLGGPTKAIRKISPETPMEEPLPSGLAIKSIRPTQQAIDDFVNMPVAMGQMIGPDALPNEDYVTYVRRKRAETGPPLFEAIRDPNVIPLNAPGVFTRLETTPQVDVSANPIARALEMAGFTREEIMRIIGERGYADGGLTKTVPPAMGPDSQGVETLFRRRYS